MLNKDRLFAEGRRRAINTVTTGISRVAKYHPANRLSKHGVGVIKDVPYTASNHRDHKLDVYYPENQQGELPAVLHIHGGGFRMLSKDTHWLMGMMFARAGFVVFNISYRLAPKHPYPAPMLDVARAYRWVVDNGHRYQADVSRLVVAGESAGGNLVCSTVVSSCFEREEKFARDIFKTGVVPKAAVPFCGILDVSNVERYANKGHNAYVKRAISDTAKGYLGGKDSAEAELASPLLVFESSARPIRPLPPFYIPVGTRDPIFDDSVRLGAALKKRGVPSVVSEYTGETHAFHAFIWREAAKQCWRDTLLYVEDAISSPPVHHSI